MLASGTAGKTQRVAVVGPVFRAEAVGWWQVAQVVVWNVSFLDSVAYGCRRR